MERTISGGTAARVPSRVREMLAATISAAQTAAMNAQADGGALPGMREAFDRADALLREWGVEVAPPGDPVEEIATAFAARWQTTWRPKYDGRTDVVFPEVEGGEPCMCALCDCTNPVDGDAAICDDCRVGEHEA